MSKYTINGRILTYKKRSIDLGEVDYVVPRRGILPQYIFMGSRNGSSIKMRVSNLEYKNILNELKAANAPLFKNLESVMEFDGAKEHLKNGKCKYIRKNNIWLTSDVVIYVPKRKFFRRDDEPVCIEVKDVLFSTTNNSKLLGFIPGKYYTYFGTASQQAVLIHPNKAQSELLNKHLIDNGSAIGTKADMLYRDCFWLGKLLSPLKFRIHEEIGFTDDAILYKYKKGSKTETLHLPFDKISYIDLEKGLLHSNHIKIFGQQNIVTELEFKNSVIEELKNILVKRNVMCANKIIEPRTCLGLLPRPFAKRSLVVTNDKLVYTDKKLKLNITLPFDCVNSIVWRKHFFFYLVGYLFIDGEIENIRRDQDNGSDTIKMPKIWYTKKNYIRSLCPRAKYNDKVSKKSHQISDITYS